jgi:hypothetical protein
MFSRTVAGEMLANSGGSGATAAAVGTMEFEAGSERTGAPGVGVTGEAAGTFVSGRVFKTPAASGVAEAGAEELVKVAGSERGVRDCPYQ